MQQIREINLKQLKPGDLECLAALFAKDPKENLFDANPCTFDITIDNTPTKISLSHPIYCFEPSPGNYVYYGMELLAPRPSMHVNKVKVIERSFCSFHFDDQKSLKEGTEKKIITKRHEITGPTSDDISSLKKDSFIRTKNEWYCS